MKKAVIAALVCTLANVASAVSLSWASATAIKFNGANLKSDNNLSGYLIYLGTSSFSESYTLTKDSTVSSVISSIGTDTESFKKGSNGMSKISGSFTFNYSDGYTNDKDKFALLLVYTKDSETYYNLTSGTYTLTGGNDEDVANLVAATDPSNASFAFSYSAADKKGKLTSGGGWTQVPEPSTAMLALAGLALLLKRRKA